VKEAPDPAAELVASVEACLDEADCCVIATAWDEFNRLNRRDLEERMKPEAIVDCWRLLDEPAGVRSPGRVEQPV